MPRLMLPSTKSVFFLLATFIAVSLLPISQSFAAGDGGGNSNTNTRTKKKYKKCNKRNYVWSRKVRKCVRVKKSSKLDDESIYEGAKTLAYDHRYREAITLLRLANNPDDPRILNFMGYSTRKLGKVEEGITYYKAALKADPDYTLVMEYMGEAFLQLGQVDKAREQLSEIKKRCGTVCHEYTQLHGEINAYLAQ